jgi:hypothetical protein
MTPSWWDLSEKRRRVLGRLSLRERRLATTDAEDEGQKVGGWESGRRSCRSETMTEGKCTHFRQRVSEGVDPRQQRRGKSSFVTSSSIVQHE